MCGWDEGVGKSGIEGRLRAFIPEFGGLDAWSTACCNSFADVGLDPRDVPSGGFSYLSAIRISRHSGFLVIFHVCFLSQPGSLAILNRPYIPLMNHDPRTL